MMEKFNNGKLYAHKVFLKGVLADIEYKKLSSNYVIRRQKIYLGKDTVKAMLKKEMKKYQHRAQTCFSWHCCVQFDVSIMV